MKIFELHIEWFQFKRKQETKSSLSQIDTFRLGNHHFQICLFFHFEDQKESVQLCKKKFIWKSWEMITW